MVLRTPLVVVLAGPNGPGKSTSAARLLREALAVQEFVNADTIAQDLPARGGGGRCGPRDAGAAAFSGA